MLKCFYKYYKYGFANKIDANTHKCFSFQFF